MWTSITFNSNFKQSYFLNYTNAKSVEEGMGITKGITLIIFYLITKKEQNQENKKKTCALIFSNYLKLQGI